MLPAHLTILHPESNTNTGSHLYTHPLIYHTLDSIAVYVPLHKMEAHCKIMQVQTSLFVTVLNPTQTRVIASSFAIEHIFLCSTSGISSFMC